MEKIFKESIMTSLRKKIMFALLASVAAVCLSAGILFAVPVRTFAQTPPAYAAETPVVEISGADSFTYSDNDKKTVITGLSETALTKIGENNFSMVIPATVESIASKAFLNKKQLTEVRFSTSAALKEIGSNAFDGCSNLKTLILPTSHSVNGEFLHIRSFAFANCGALENVTIPGHVKTLANGAFSNASSLKEIRYNALDCNPVSESPFAGLNASNNVKVYIGNSSAKITYIPTSLFNRTNIKEVKINNVTLTENGFKDSIFADCKYLTKVNFESCSITTIGTGVFNGCSSLAEINLGDLSNLTTIGENAFYQCVSLYKITVPQNVSSIGSNAFLGCLRLVEIDNRSNLNIVAGQNAISNNGANGDVAVSVFSQNAVKYVYNGGNGESTRLSENGDYIFYNDNSANPQLLIGYTGTATRLELPTGFNYNIYNRAFFNKNNITSVKIPSNVIEINQYAFAGCTALTEVVFAETISTSTLSDYAFNGCSSLISINIPKSVTKIGQQTFAGCSSLKTVQFTDDSRLKTMDAQAFLNCNSLEVFEIPEGVTSFGADVFKGCTKLSIVYLSKSLSNYDVSGLFDTDTKNNRLLIAPSNESYDNYSKVSVWNTYGTLTFEVPVYLVYGDYKVESDTAGEHHIEYKLFGLDYTYTKNDNVWTKNAEAGMPVQHGYSKSVWYSDGEITVGEGVVTATELNEMLKEYGIITLYARYYDYKDLRFELANGVITPNSPNTPMGAIKADSWEDAEGKLNSSQYGERYAVEIAGYTPVAGKADELPEKLQNAGTYIIRVNLNAKYGKWDVNAVDAAQYIQKDYTVEPVMLDLNTENNLTDILNWGVIGGNPLTGGQKLYIYGNTPYLQEQDNPDLGTPKIVNVSASSLMYNNKGWSIELLVGSDYLTAIKSYTADDNSSIVTGENGVSVGVKATSAGVYTAKATFIAGNNYRLKYVTPQDNPYGIKISETRTAEGYEYVVEKVWYIVTSDASQLIDGDNGGIYDLTDGWTYGGKAPGKPVLSSSVTHGMEEQLITFTIENELIFGTEAPNVYNYAMYGEIINSSMPASVYTLTIYIADYKDVPGNGENGVSWTFEVKECGIEELVRRLKSEGKISGTNDLWGNLYNNMAVKPSFEVEYMPGIVQFASTAGVPALKLNEETIQGERKGIWAKPQYDKYYGRLTMQYNVESAKNGSLSGNTYYTAENYVNGPNAAGRYTVYLNVTANNYTNLVNINSESVRKGYYYTLYIKHYIDVATLNLGAAKYTGEPVRFANSDIFKILYLDGSAPLNDVETRRATALYCRDGKLQNYTNASDEVFVALTFRENFADSYGWKNAAVDTSEGQGFIKFTFAIERADNSTTIPLYLRDWEWGKQSEFEIRWGTAFGSEELYTYTLQSVKNASLVYHYKPVGNQQGFDKADAGEYKLIATVVGGKGYNWNTYTEERSIIIAKSNATLDNTPFIESWKYGDFETMYKAPVLELSGGFASLASDVKSFITTLAHYKAYLEGGMSKEDMTAWPTINEMLDSNGEVPAGSYVYVYGLDENGNYAEWEYAINFSVLQVNNYWDITPTVHDWVYGDYATRDITINCQPHFGNKNSVIYYYRNSYSSWVTEIPADWLDRNNELEVGEYQFRAHLQGDANYSDLDTYLSFSVTPAKNAWKEDGVPGVKSWSQGNWDSKGNALTAQAKYGTVVFEVYSASDKEHKNALDIKNLNSLGVGSYVLVARVEGTGNYAELIGESTFAVFEDSVGMTGIIAATAVFAVVAIGLAIGGVVLLILRNKKIEEEFRKMIKSELRRK